MGAWDELAEGHDESSSGSPSRHVGSPAADAPADRAGPCWSTASVSRPPVPDGATESRETDWIAGSPTPRLTAGRGLSG